MRVSVEVVPKPLTYKVCTPLSCGRNFRTAGRFFAQKFIEGDYYVKSPFDEESTRSMYVRHRITSRGAEKPISNENGSSKKGGNGESFTLHPFFPCSSFPGQFKSIFGTLCKFKRPLMEDIDITHEACSDCWFTL